MIVDVCSRIANKPPNTLLAKTWEVSAGRTLRLVLKKEDWLKLPKFLDIPDDMAVGDATQIRRAVTLAPERADYRDRWYFKDASPFMACSNDFWNDLRQSAFASISIMSM